MNLQSLSLLTFIDCVQNLYCSLEVTQTMVRLRLALQPSGTSFLGETLMFDWSCIFYMVVMVTLSIVLFCSSPVGPHSAYFFLLHHFTPTVSSSVGANSFSEVQRWCAPSGGVIMEHSVEMVLKTWSPCSQCIKCVISWYTFNLMNEEHSSWKQIRLWSDILAFKHEHETEK